MATLRDLARMTTDTTGTGTMDLVAADDGCLSFDDAGLTEGDVVTYGIEDGTNREVGKGIFSSDNATLSRDIIYSSTNSGSAISLSGNAKVSIVASYRDIQSIEKNVGWGCYHGQNIIASSGYSGGGTAPSMVLQSSSPDLGPVWRCQTATSTGAGTSQSAAYMTTAILKMSSGGYTGGFTYRCRFAVSHAADASYFLGLSNSTFSSASLQSDDPAGQHIGFWYRPSPSALAHTNWHFMSQDSGSTLSADDTGVAVVANDLYEVQFYCKPGDTTIYWKIIELSASPIVVTTGSKTTNLPTSTTRLIGQVAAQNQTAGTARSLWIQECQAFVFDPETP